jgi:hypothetical protein
MQRVIHQHAAAATTTPTHGPNSHGGNGGGGDYGLFLSWERERAGEDILGDCELWVVFVSVKLYLQNACGELRVFASLAGYLRYVKMNMSEWRGSSGFVSFRCNWDSGQGSAASVIHMNVLNRIGFSLSPKQE